MANALWNLAPAATLGQRNQVFGGEWKRCTQGEAAEFGVIPRRWADVPGYDKTYAVAAAGPMDFPDPTPTILYPESGSVAVAVQCDIDSTALGDGDWRRVFSDPGWVLELACADVQRNTRGSPPVGYRSVSLALGDDSASRASGGYIQWEDHLLSRGAKLLQFPLSNPNNYGTLPAKLTAGVVMGRLLDASAPAVLVIGQLRLRYQTAQIPVMRSAGWIHFSSTGTPKPLMFEDGAPIRRFPGWCKRVTIYNPTGSGKNLRVGGLGECGPNPDASGFQLLPGESVAFNVDRIDSIECCCEVGIDTQSVPVLWEA